MYSWQLSTHFALFPTRFPCFQTQFTESGRIFPISGLAKSISCPFDIEGQAPHLQIESDFGQSDVPGPAPAIAPFERTKGPLHHIVAPGDAFVAVDGRLVPGFIALSLVHDPVNEIAPLQDFLVLFAVVALVSVNRVAF